MKISTRGRYALRVMIDLAEHWDEGLIPLNQIAQRQEISEKYLESILKTLVQAELVTGVRGKGGGYRMTQKPEECSVGAIVRAAEGSIAPVACLEEGAAPCQREATCRTVGVWQKLNTLVNDYLDSVTVAQLLQDGE